MVILTKNKKFVASNNAIIQLTETRKKTTTLYIAFCNYIYYYHYNNKQCFLGKRMLLSHLGSNAKFRGF